MSVPGPWELTSVVMAQTCLQAVHAQSACAIRSLLHYVLFFRPMSVARALYWDNAVQQTPAAGNVERANTSVEGNQYN
jgi:hypothetical protein